MKKLLTAAAMAALLGASVNVNAWWGFPFGGWSPWGGNGWGNDWFGDGFMDFNFSMSARGHGWGRGWGRYYDYYGPYGHPYWGGAPYAALPLAAAPAAPATTEAK